MISSSCPDCWAVPLNSPCRLSFPCRLKPNVRLWCPSTSFFFRAGKKMEHRQPGLPVPGPPVPSPGPTPPCQGPLWLPMLPIGIPIGVQGLGTGPVQAMPFQQSTTNGSAPAGAESRWAGDTVVHGVVCHQPPPLPPLPPPPLPTNLPPRRRKWFPQTKERKKFELVWVPPV